MPRYCSLVEAGPARDRRPYVVELGDGTKIQRALPSSPPGPNTASCRCPDFLLPEMFVEAMSNASTRLSAKG
jgi:hypothetical protein